MKNKISVAHAFFVCLFSFSFFVCVFLRFFSSFFLFFFFFFLFLFLTLAQFTKWTNSHVDSTFARGVVIADKSPKAEITLNSAQERTKEKERKKRKES